MATERRLAVCQGSPEGRLILAALRARHGPASELSELADEADWAAVVHHARQLRLPLFLKDGLTRAGVYERVPAVLRCELEEALKEATAFTLYARQVLERVAEELGDMPYLLLRGPVMGELLYGSQLPRPFTDLDFLVRAGDWERVWLAAERLSGGRPLRSKWMLDPLLDEFVVLSSDRLPLRQARRLATQATLWGLDCDVAQDFTVEFKTCLVRGIEGQVGAEVAWATRVECQWLDMKVSVPGWELTVPHIATHAAGHWEPGSRLLGLLDLDAIARLEPEIEWATCAQWIARTGTELPCWVLCETARRLLDAPLPEGWLKQIAPAGPAGRVAAQVVRGDVLATSWGPLTPLAPLREVARAPARWRALEPTRLVKRLARALVPSPSYVRWQYGGHGLGGLLRGYALHWWLQRVRVLRRRWLPPG